MSNEGYASAVTGDEKDKNLVIPLMIKEPPATDVPPAEYLTTEQEVTEDTECGIGFIRGKFLQRLATKNVYVFMYSILGLFLYATWAYSSATITTLEKRFKIPSKTIGYIAVGNDITQISVALFLSYYAGKGHRPRWMAFGIYTSIANCLLTITPHFLYGPGEEALSLTKEYGELYSNTSGMYYTADKDVLKKLCIPNAEGFHCDASESQWAPIIILFIASFVSGIGGSMFWSIGASYMDDNIKKKTAPALFSMSMLLRLLGPSMGYGLGSLCLKLYIAPSLTPTIDQTDPRWLGAWWIGWAFLAGLLTISGSLLALFPKVLPKTAARKTAASHNAKLQNRNGAKSPESISDMPASFADMKKTFKRLLKNPILLCNNAASVFYVFGYEPYWIFMAKYIETQYRKSASVASLTTGTVGLAFSAGGIILAGFVITKYKPTARQMSMWNVFVGLVSAICIASYTLVGCPANSSFGEVTSGGELRTDFTCNTQCNCKYVPYSPVCTSNGKSTFISACHAGCSSFSTDEGGKKTYTNCSCIPPENADPVVLANWTLSSHAWTDGGWATPGPCPVECNNSFIAFLAVVCLLKFCGATGRATNFLVSVRCVEEKDKPVAIALESTLISVFAMMPSLIFFGRLIDLTCLVWGKTCSGTGNCWLYDNDSFRYLLNLTAAGFILVGTMFDLGVFYNVKNLKIFDDEEQSQHRKMSNDKNTRQMK